MSAYQNNESPMKRILLAIILLLSTMAVRAQGFLPGYYVDAGGTKVEGEISYNRTDLRKTIAKEMQYITFKSELVKKTVIYADGVQYFVAGGEKYVSMGGKETVFLHVVMDGTVKVYAKYKKTSVTVSTPTVAGFNHTSYREVKADYLWGYDADEPEPITKENFSKVMTKAAADVPQMVQLIKEGNYKLRNIGEMLDMYKAIKNRKTE